MAKDPDLASSAPKLVPTYSCCVAFIAITSMHSAAMREAYILRRSLEIVPDLEIDGDFFEILYHDMVYDKILTYACKHVDAWSDVLVPIVKQDGNFSDVLPVIEETIRLYVTLRFKEIIRQPSPNEKGWFLQRICGLGNARDVQVVRYCSKRCRRDSWYRHHRHIDTARRRCLLAGLEANVITDIAPVGPYSEERLVIELALDKDDVLVRPLRHYLFLFNVLSEKRRRGNFIVLELGGSKGSVIAINDRYF
ncbi:hypothetical protein EDB19DRAFT_2025042 [Suillus lakei]|nr:hypothetical protein EDB19DRAFT_2025042 [Suillus lakei]